MPASCPVFTQDRKSSRFFTIFQRRNRRKGPLEAPERDETPLAYVYPVRQKGLEFWPFLHIALFPIWVGSACNDRGFHLLLQEVTLK